MGNKILKEITEFCKEFASHECCSEEYCVYIEYNKSLQIKRVEPIRKLIKILKVLGKEINNKKLNKEKL